MIDVYRLRVLSTVATYGTVTAAAGALHCTPSAVSQHLAKLEREAGEAVVERDGRRLRLTEAGRILVEHATRVLAAVEETEAALAAHRGTVSGRLVLAAFPTACRGLLPHALRRLTTDHPALRAGLLESDRDSMVDGLRRGAIDVAVLDEWPEVPVTLAPELSTVALGEDVADLCVPLGHPLADGPVAPSADERWIASVPGSVCHEWLTRIVPGVRPDYLVAEFETQLALVAAGLGVTFIPRLARGSVPAGVVVRAVSPPPARRVHVAWRGAAERRPAIMAAVGALRDAWKHRAS